jgi:ABC-2 type transport system ATP-binding protein
MAGVLTPTAGTVRVDGIDSADDPPAVRARVGLMPEVPGLYERMTVRAYLDHFGAIYDIDPSTRKRRIDDLLEIFELTDAGDRWLGTFSKGRIDDLLEIFELTDAGDRWLGTFSKGMRQKVALIRATLHRPRLVLADEPTSALDPDSARRAWIYLKELQKDGCALVICTHSMEEAEHLAQPAKSGDFAGRSGAIGIMSGGKALAIGDMQELRRESGLKTRQEIRELPTLQDIYLAIVGNHGVGEERELAATRSA